MGWLGFLCSIGEKPFLVGLVDQPFQPASNWVEMVEKAFASLCCVIVAHIENDYSQELPRFNQKRSEKCSTEKGQPYQPKPVAVERLIPIDTFLFPY